MIIFPANELINENYPDLSTYLLKAFDENMST